MPQRRTAIKDLRKSRVRHMHNQDTKTDLKKTLKAFIVATKDKKADAKEALNTLYKKFDKAAKTKLIHKKTASRRKSRYAKMLVAAQPVAK